MTIHYTSTVVDAVEDINTFNATKHYVNSSTLVLRIISLFKNLRIANILVCSLVGSGNKYRHTE